MFHKLLRYSCRRLHNDWGECPDRYFCYSIAYGYYSMVRALGRYFY